MSDGRIHDGLLLRRYREEGDESAFAEIVRRYGRLVHATCLRETGDANLAEDAAQGVFLLLSRKQFGDDSSLAGWLHGASRLVSRNLLRGESRRRQRERKAFEEYSEPEAAWQALSPQIDAALAALKHGEREAVLLRFAANMSFADVGSTLGVEENTARMRVARALEKVRQHLRRAGVGVGVALLSTLLSTRLADAQSIVYVPPSPKPREATKGGPFHLRWTSVHLSAVAATAALIGGAWWASVPKRANLSEVQGLFISAEGPWKGDLEFADDRSGQRTTTDVRVTVSKRESTFTFTATYPAFSSVDTTTFSLLNDGSLRIDNGGARASHNLDGVYTPYRKGDGFEFTGVSPTLQAEVRLHLSVSSNQLSLREEYRRDDGEFRFRNRYTLSR